MTWLILAAALAAAPPDLQGPIAALRAVGPDGKGSLEAARAWPTVATAEVSRLPELLAGMDGANTVARNWLRAAVDQVLAKAHAEKKALPEPELEAFVRDTKHDPKARRLAYELLAEADKAAPQRLLPGMLDDPSAELRRDAVARLLDDAEKQFSADKKADSLPLFKKGLAAARDKDQIDKAVRRLRELGQTVDLPAHLGLVMDWHFNGPFPNVKREGTDKAFPPEKGVDLKAEYDGKAGKVRWVPFLSKSEMGIIDLVEKIGHHPEAVGYAVTEFNSDRDQAVEIRLGCYTAFKLWINGTLVLDRGDAFTGMRLDHYVAKVHLKKGKNQFLMKVIQDDPPPYLPKQWRFLLRVCDANGVAVLSTARPASPTEPAAPAKPADKKS